MDLSSDPRVVVALILIGSLFVLPQASTETPNGAIIQNDTSYRDSFGNYHVIGEVRNTGITWLQSIVISAVLKDKTGTTVDIKQGSPWLKNLPPQTALGFDVLEPDTFRSSLIQSYTLNLTYKTGQPLTPSLVINKLTTSKNSLGWLQVQGEIANIGSSESQMTNVTGTFYGSDGKIVFTTFTSPALSTIQPDSSQSFTLTIVDATRSKLVTRYAIIAESHEYTSTLANMSIPEFQSGSALIIALSLISVAVTRKTR
jgi:hypothetical protein